MGNGQWAMGNGQKNITIKKVFGDKEPKDLSLEVFCSFLGVKSCTWNLNGRLIYIRLSCNFFILN
jgi:hypothetical protein